MISVQWVIIHLESVPCTIIIAISISHFLMINNDPTSYQWHQHDDLDSACLPWVRRQRNHRIFLFTICQYTWTFFFQCWPKILIRRAYGNKRSIYDFAWLRVNKMFCLMFFLRSIYIAMFSGAMTKVQNFSLQCFYKALSAFNTSYYFILKTIFSL